MTSLLMRRSAWIFLACFSVALALAVLRAQGDIRRESQGADQMARFVERTVGPAEHRTGRG
jgi:hypothetical protein